ncbi:MAG: carboxypeptidase regulatory-like domain-containing protein [Elusimicrobia bacterium]|nr:carboxypeptidase regulatory-like domain-containing protein [Elusimicrobiota bacterium]
MRRRLGSRGVSLVELMVAVAILSIGILGFFGAFRFITKSVHASRSRTLAANLTQERIENLKNISYYSLLVTTSADVDNSFTPGITYDNVNYPPDTVAIGNIVYKRYTFVSLAQINNNVISTVTFTYPDTGMKQITVHVIWSEEGNQKKWSMSNLLENPNVAPLDCSYSGAVTRNTGGNLSGALVRVLQNPDWQAETDSSGNYTFRAHHGTYDLRASLAGFYDQTQASIGCVLGSNYIQNFALTQITTGQVSGNVWMNTNLVVAQVVVATYTWAGNNDTFAEVEYVSLYNPTTFAINIGDDITADQVSMNYQEEGGASSVPPGSWNFVHFSTYIPPLSYYLIANATAFMINGAVHNVDACYKNGANCDTSPDPAGTDFLKNNSAAQLIVGDPINWIAYDTICWDDGDTVATDAGAGLGTCEGTSIPNYNVPPLDGIGLGNMIVRVSSPGAPVLSLFGSYGSAYDSDDNRSDFRFPSDTFIGIPLNAGSVFDGEFPVIAGKPGIGALVTSNDSLSGSTVAYRDYIASTTYNLAFARYTIPAVSTGTWAVVIATNTYYKQISNVIVTANATTAIPNAATTPAEPYSGGVGQILSSHTLGGFVNGVVVDVNGSGVSGISVLAGGKATTTGANGRYFVQTSSGPIYVIANPNNANPVYIQDIAQVTLSAGEVATQNFTMLQGGLLTGYVTSGTTPLPNVVVAATLGGNQMGSGTSDTSGTFIIRNLSTGTYTIKPVLDTGQDSSPNSMSATVVSTSSVFVGTFTVAGSLGNIAGTITYKGEPLTTGALVLASSASIASVPSALAASSAPALTPLYAVSSKADGTYEIATRGTSTYTYNLAVYVPEIQGDGSVVITTKTWSGISVSPSATTNLDLTIP